MMGKLTYLMVAETDIIRYLSGVVPADAIKWHSFSFRSAAKAMAKTKQPVSLKAAAGRGG